MIINMKNTLRRFLEAAEDLKKEFSGADFKRELEQIGIEFPKVNLLIRDSCCGVKDIFSDIDAEIEILDCPFRTQRQEQKYRFRIL